MADEADDLTECWADVDPKQSVSSIPREMRLRFVVGSSMIEIFDHHGEDTQGEMWRDVRDALRHAADLAGGAVYTPSDGDTYLDLPREVALAVGLLTWDLTRLGYTIEVRAQDYREMLDPQPMTSPTPRLASPVECEHANEAPRVCPCPADCYCKTRTCTVDFVHYGVRVGDVFSRHVHRPSRG